MITTTMTSSDWDPLSEYSVSHPKINDNDMLGCPVTFSSQWDGFWSLLSHETITQAMRDTESFVSGPAQTYAPMLTGTPWRPLRSDLPHHRDYRMPLIQFFRSKRIASVEPRTTELTNQLIDTFIDDFAAVNDVRVSPGSDPAATTGPLVSEAPAVPLRGLRRRRPDQRRSDRRARCVHRLSRPGGLVPVAVDRQ